jgi:hypothetical protein
VCERDESDGDASSDYGSGRRRERRATHKAKGGERERRATHNVRDVYKARA